MKNNQIQLRKMRDQLPYGYAQEAIDRLAETGVHVKRSDVYNVAQGVTTNLAVLNVLADIARESSKATKEVDKKLSQIS